MLTIRAPAVEDGTVVALVHVAAGAMVGQGELLVTPETPSIFLEVVAPAEGFVQHVAVAVGSGVVEGSELAVLGAVDHLGMAQAVSRAERPTQEADEGDSIHSEVARIIEESARQALI